MSPANERGLSEKVDRLVESVASLKTAQELHRSDALEKHIQNRTDIHSMRGDIQAFFDKFIALKDEIREVLSDEKKSQEKELKKLAEEIRANALQHAETKWVPKIVQAVIVAVLLAILTALVNHAFPGAKL